MRRRHDSVRRPDGAGHHGVPVVRGADWAAVDDTRVLESRADGARPAHILGGWSPSTPRFPKSAWEIVKIHDFSLKLIDFHEKSM